MSVGSAATGDNLSTYQYKLLLPLNSLFSLSHNLAVSFTLNFNPELASALFSLWLFGVIVLRVECIVLREEVGMQWDGANI